MGSRKHKKQAYPDKVKFLSWYRSLSILDKIAFKAYLFNVNRSRINLKDLFTYPYFWQIGPYKRKHMIIEGYAVNWWTGFS